MKNVFFSKTDDGRELRRLFLFSFAAAFLVITVCSRSSFLYPINDWVDSQCFFTTGRAMFNGSVLYRDIYEQKGPLLYFVHGLASLISETSFIGVYLLEIICAGFFLYYAARFMRLWVTERQVYFLIPAAAALVFSCTAFKYGDSAEELCLPLLMHSLFITVRAVKNDEKLTAAQKFALGCAGGCVLWIKFTMLGFYIGLALMFFIDAARRHRLHGHGILRVAGSFLTAFLGFAAVSLPVIAYFAVNGAIRDCWLAYFYNNIFVYSTEGFSKTGILKTLWKLVFNIGKAFVQNPQILLFAPLGIVADRRGAANAYVLSCFLFTAFFVYIGGRAYPYYAFILTVFSVYGFAMLPDVLKKLASSAKKRRTETVRGRERKLKKNAKAGTAEPKAIAALRKRIAACAKTERGYCRLVGLYLLLCTAFALLATPNRYLMAYKKADLPQYAFAEIIKKSGKTDPTLLNYGFLDGGFYTASGILPNCKFFCTLNIPLPEMNREQREAVRTGRVDYVVTRDKQLFSGNYSLVCKKSFYLEGKMRVYYLYELVPLNARRTPPPLAPAPTRE